MFSKFAPMPESVGFAVFKRNVACVTSISFPFSGRGAGRRKRASERANERAWGEQKMERSREEWARRRGDEEERTLFFCTRSQFRFLCALIGASAILTCDQASLIFFVAAGKYVTKNVRDA